MVHNDTENTENTFIKGFLNINECFISFVCLDRICRYSKLNLCSLSVLKSCRNTAICCEFSERSIGKAICQVFRNFFGLRTHTKLIKCINNNCLYS